LVAAPRMTASPLSVNMWFLESISLAAAAMVATLPIRGPTITVPESI
jgi:hypothetical protein